VNKIIEYVQNYYYKDGYEFYLMQERINYYIDTAIIKNNNLKKLFELLANKLIGSTKTLIGSKHIENIDIYRDVPVGNVKCSIEELAKYREDIMNYFYRTYNNINNCPYWDM
jgi:hypothetical protein